MVRSANAPRRGSIGEHLPAPALWMMGRGNQQLRDKAQEKSGSSARARQGRGRSRICSRKEMEKSARVSFPFASPPSPILFFPTLARRHSLSYSRSVSLLRRLSSCSWMLFLFFFLLFTHYTADFFDLIGCCIYENMTLRFSSSFFSAARGAAVLLRLHRLRRLRRLASLLLRRHPLRPQPVVAAASRRRRCCFLPFSAPRSFPRAAAAAASAASSAAATSAAAEEEEEERQKQRPRCLLPLLRRLRLHRL